MESVEEAATCETMDISCLQANHIKSHKLTTKDKLMKQKKGFVLRDVCGERVIVGEGLETINFGKLISLNETAAFLWKKAGESDNFTTQQLAEALLEEYEVSADQALADVERIVKEWQEVGIVE